ncbi:MAG: hypothetical protein ACM3XO_09085 [Bacteroidota bacterium]
MRRLPWEILLALLVGIGLGLVYSWMISPRPVIDADPGSLRVDFKDQYRSAIAAAYAATGNLPRAQARLALIKDPDPIAALNAQAQRMLAQAGSAPAADQVAALASALQEGSAGPASVSNQVTKTTPVVEETTTATSLPPSPDMTFAVTDSSPVPLLTDTQPPTLPVAPPRPTRTPVPTPDAPFKLTGQDELCDPNLPEGLLQVIVLSSNRRQLPGMEIDITWEGNAQQFFTGLKPELGNGYADFVMTADTSYTVQLAAGSDIATGLTAPTCQASDGGTFYGGLKLTFQQP